jgi:3-hydroxyisobutyrate dehydrogenase-like beta-hydroxyacid dehydrogenase
VSETANVGLIGCGHWGKNILRDLVSLGCRVHVVARSEASIGRATEGGAVSITNDLGGLPEPDG